MQAFIALTDNLEADKGGFEACIGWHLEFDRWRQERPWSYAAKGAGVSPPCAGDFTPVRPREDEEIIARMRHVPCRAGDLVLWDYRIPHSNALRNEGGPREVVYIG